MIITLASAENFQSYESLEFNYADLGLVLVSGPTGAGKSTLLDLIPWVLYGSTSKDGASDDVRAWGASESTKAQVRLILPGNDIIAVTRIRGKSSENDLYWVENESECEYAQIRGKDLTETQKLLEARLGVSAELFILGSYLTQFSKADSFFIAKAKDRREVLEKIADQEFAIQLGEKSSDARKTAKKERDALSLELGTITGKLQGLTDSVAGLQSSKSEWDYRQVNKIEALQDKFNNYDVEHTAAVRDVKARSTGWKHTQAGRIAELKDSIAEIAPLLVSDSAFVLALNYNTEEERRLRSTRCKECGGAYQSTQLEVVIAATQQLKEDRHQNNTLIDRRKSAEAALKTLKDSPNPHLSSITQLEIQTNPYAEQISAAKAEINPFNLRIDTTFAAMEVVECRLRDISSKLTAATELVSRLDWLYDKSFELRGILMQRAVSQIQDTTNNYLERFFDAALRIQLSVEDSDKIEVDIYNEGHTAPFRSLSGGERCLLKLCFSLSLMKAAQEKAGVSFGAMMLDEPFNGMSVDLKTKAFGLLQELSTSYGTVLVIEHDESVQALFDVKYLVDKSNGTSTIVLNDTT